MNEGTQLNFWKIAKYRVDYFDKSYKKLDSIYIADYTEKINFINSYKKEYPISGTYEQRIKIYLKSQLYASELWLGSATKDKIDQEYSNYLTSLKEEIQVMVSAPEKSIYRRLEYCYIRYTYKELLHSSLYADSLYAACKREIHEEMKDEMLLTIVKDEIQNNGNSTKWFIKDFIETSKNTDFKSYVADLLESSKLNYSAGKNNILIDINNHTLKYDSIVRSLRGYVIYIDTWASWCAPCREEMPNSLVIREKYKNKKVVFIYLSIDENMATWKKANKDESLHSYTNSYLLLNAKKSNFVKQLKIGSIPRYILIDKKGEIINRNAPRPSDPKIKVAIDKLLSL